MEAILFLVPLLAQVAGWRFLFGRWAKHRRSGGGGAKLAGGATVGSGTANQGFAGGQATPNTTLGHGCGGGGGAGGVGGNGTAGGVGGAGGNGVASSITGSSVSRAGGGGGATNTAGTAGTGTNGGGNGSNTGVGSAGTVNTGGGGGGGGNSGSGPFATGGTGGSGVVIIKVPNSVEATFSGGVTSSLSTSVSGVQYLLGDCDIHNRMRL
jgi:hypothetical protein